MKNIKHMHFTKQAYCNLLKYATIYNLYNYNYEIYLV